MLYRERLRCLVSNPTADTPSGDRLTRPCRQAADDLTWGGGNAGSATASASLPRRGHREWKPEGGKRDGFLHLGGGGRGGGRAAGGRRLLRLPRPLPDPVPGELLPLVLWQVPSTALPPLPFCPPRLAPLPSTGINLDVLSLLDPTARREIEQAAGHAELSATDLGLAASCSFLLPVDRKELCWFEVVKDSWVC